MGSKPYGSGYFGEWMEDEFGLPAYRYTCNQVKDPKAVTPVNKDLRHPSEHLHQIGNDRVVGVASNYGYVQVRQDEGSPKFLNDYDPSGYQYAGGFGYLTDGKTTVSTYYEGQDAGFDRVFGVGYFRKTVTLDPYRVDQVIFAPFGDDPLLISQVKVTNAGTAPADLRWLEYWGCRMYQFSFLATIYAGAEHNMGMVAGIRRAFAERFTRATAPVEKNRGLLTKTRFKGSRAQYLKESLGGAFKFPARDISFEDLTPPQTFLVSLDAPVQGLGRDAQAFFGSGGTRAPDGLKEELGARLKYRSENSAMILERRFHLEPGEVCTLHFAYGYLPVGFDLEDLIRKYQVSCENLLASSSNKWKEDHRVKLALPDEPWIDRELQWHHYYLRSNLTFDSYFQEHILSQGSVYQYIIGFQGAARDPLQHAQPFIFSRPRIVKEVLRYTLKSIQPDGSVPYAITGHGALVPGFISPSDQEMWLLWLASEFVLATRDTGFLDETVKTYPDDKGRSRSETVMKLLARSGRHLIDHTGTGKHGLLRLRKGDWNDSVVVEYAADEDKERVYEKAESVLNGAMASYVLDLYARMLIYAGHPAMAEEIRALAEKQRQAVRATWNGKWFKRAWMTPETGWAGDDMMWLEPQPWAVIGGAATPDQTAALIKTIDRQIRQRSPLGAFYMNEPLKKSRIAPGAGANAGIWPSINGTLVWALALTDPAMAWDEWKKNTLARHAEVYPDIWYGIWSGPDKINSALSGYPGQTQFDESLLKASGVNSTKAYGLSGMNWTDFPVMNMHAHAWPLYSLAKLLGIEFTPDGVHLVPVLPEDEYSFETPLIGLKKSQVGFSGWYAPQKEGKWTVVFGLDRETRPRFTGLEVNGQAVQAVPDSDGKLTFSGNGSQEKPLTWTIALR